MDDFFRDKFKDFELFPPDHIWENIKKQVHGSDTVGRSLSNGGIIGITVLLIITSLFTYYLLQDNSGNGVTPALNIKEKNTGSSFHSLPRKADLSASNKISEKITFDNSPKDISVKQTSLKPQARFELTAGSSDVKGKTSLSAPEPGMVNEQKPLIYLDKSGDFQQSDIPEKTSISGNFDSGNDNDLQELTDTDNSKNSPEPAPVIHNDYGRESKWSFGLFFTPEMIYYPSASEFNSRNYSLDLNAIYQFSGYLIQSGMGVGFSSDNGNYKIDYNQYLGSYQDVYNVTFDTIGGQLIPVYHTETMHVYDTIDHVSISPTKRKFTYLNIPLLVGYGHEGRRFGWYIKAGPTFSVLLHENTPDINLADSRNKITYVQNELPGRLKTNWQFVFSGGTAYKLGNSLSFTLEPVFRYYINSTYEQNQTTLKSPFALGIRAGFVLDF